jgi:hypothetical protein
MLRGLRCEAMSSDAKGPPRPDGDLVDVASVRDQPEGELVQALLKSAGIPSVLRQTGINGPLLGIGLLPRASQRVMVHASQAEAARRILGEATDRYEPESSSVADEAGYGGRGARNYTVLGAYARAWILSMAALALAFGVFMLLRAT